MDSIQQIGRPNFRHGDDPAESSGDEENRSPKIVAPALLSIPSKENYHPTSGFVHCCIIRQSSSCYHLAFQIGSTEIVSIIAKKLKSSRTSNYHLFDALRGGVNAKLTKKAGHYMGKLRRDKDQPPGCYTLYTASREREQVAAYVYDIPALMQQVREGQPPRKMQAVIPKTSEGKDGSICVSNESGSSRASITAHGHGNRLIEHLHNGTWAQHKLVALQTRPPKYQEGQYRLNFSGRVLTPSVKNMQLENENGECLLQFGKVNEKRFHLDYKAPFNAFSAFGAALCQFDL